MSSRVSKKWIVTSVIVILASIVAFMWLPERTQQRIIRNVPGIKRNDTIVIQPFEGLPPYYSSFVYSELKKSYPRVKLNTPVTLPHVAYYAPRGRYRADTLIAWLSRRAGLNTTVIGLTQQDISTSKDGIADWGIMGLGYQPGNACIVSTFRLHKNNLHNQLYKVSVHELGHTFGAAHCSEKCCFMRDAEGQNHLDEESKFCVSCMNIMQRTGWH